MQIVCPHCSTSFGIDSAKLGDAGRSVRCSRCKEVWLARREDAVELAPVAVGSHQQDPEQDAASEWDALAREQDDADNEAPHVDSPSIAGDLQGSADWTAEARHDQDSADNAEPGRFPWLGRFIKPKAARPGPGRKTPFSLTTACAAMGALVLALVIWRAEMVRLLPQTAAFYKLVGLDVNLRGLRFRDVKVSSETVEGTSMLVIEGAITDDSSKPVELPRLRFSIRDAQGAEIYAWNTVLEQSFLRPGERAVFKSRLASPPPGGRNIDVRFFNKRDITGGHA
jgi:predicted Zn finger-like uncharacterized protein